MRDYLILLRKKKGLSQENVAERMLMSQNYLSLIEAGARQTDLKLSTLICFSKIYNIDVKQLIRLEEKYQQSLKVGETEKT